MAALLAITNVPLANPFLTCSPLPISGEGLGEGAGYTRRMFRIVIGGSSIWPSAGLCWTARTTSMPSVT